MNSEDASRIESNTRLILREGPLPETSIELGQAGLVIGRSPSSDFVISFSAVSGRHALISFENNQYIIEDLNSSNGTFINDRRLTGRQPLQNNDEIRLGQTIYLTFVTETLDRTMLQPAPGETILEDDLDLQKAAKIAAAGQAAAPKAPPEPPPSQLPPTTPPSAAVGETLLFDESMLEEPNIAAVPPQLQVAIAGDAPQSQVLSKAAVAIGRADDNDVVILSKIVSRHHARLERVDGGYLIVPFPDAGNPDPSQGPAAERANAPRPR